MMRSKGKAILALGIVALMAVPAWAQEGRGRGRFFGGGGGPGGPAALLSNKSVQKELKLTEEQAEKLTTFSQAMIQKQREAFQKSRDLPEEERRQKFQEVARETAAELIKVRTEILKPEQAKRFEEIMLQQSGIAAFSMPRVQAALKLTGEQTEKVREIAEQGGQAVRDAFRAGDPADREALRKKMTEIRKESSEKAVNLLNDEQKAKWKELTGEPFEVVYEPRPQG